MFAEKSQSMSGMKNEESMLFFSRFCRGIWAVELLGTVLQGQRKCLCGKLCR